MTEYMKPIININGATRESHVQSRLTARRAVYQAMIALQETKPHGRDYLGNTEQYNADLAIFNVRFVALDKLYNDLQDEAIAIQES